MGRLMITTLGETQVWHADALCPLPIRKVQALAFYLGVTAQAHPRARLGALLWPDADASHSLLNLRQVLLRLRQALGTDADAHLLTTGDLVRLDLGPDGAVDVATLGAATSPHASSAMRLAALAGYGGPFLAHLTLDDAPDFMAWVAGQRTHWEACYDLIAEQELRRRLNDGQTDAARTLGQDWVARRSDAEAAYHWLATAQATDGDVAGARLTLATATRMWADLGLDLTHETQALAERLASFAPAMAVPEHALRLPFVGRHDAFAQLRGAYARASAGVSSAALVQGEAGLGKSRLVDAFTHWAMMQGADVAAGHAYELSGRLPYQPLMELLRERLAREHAPDDLLDDSWLCELQRLVPELHDRYPDLPLPVDDPAAGTRLLEAIAQLGMALARQRPLVWLIDDLHWADDATRDGLIYLLGRWAEAKLPTLLVVTLRSEEVAATPALTAWITAAQRAVPVTEASLMPLTVAQTADALSALLAATATSDLCAWLHGETAGNPLYLEHVLQSLAERGVIQWQGDAPRLDAAADIPALAAWLPQTLRGLLLRSVYRLDATAQQVLAAAAIVGTQFSEDLLPRLTEVNESTVLAALEAAEHALLIRAEGARYRFSHDKVAEAVYGDLTPARRRLYHRRALVALAEASHAPPAELARHALGAEDWEVAMRHLQRAAEAARQIGANQDAIHLYERMVSLLTTPPSHAVLFPQFMDVNIEMVYEPLGWLYLNRREAERAQRLYESLLGEVQAFGNPRIEGRVCFLLGSLALNTETDPTVALRYLGEAQRLAVSTNDIQGLLSAERLLADIAEEAGNLTQAHHHADHVVRLARAHGEPLKLAQGLNVLGGLATSQGQWALACASAEESVLLFAWLSQEAPPPAPGAYHFATVLAWDDFLTRILPLFTAAPTTANNRARQWGADGLSQMGVARLHLGQGMLGRQALDRAWRIWAERRDVPSQHHKLFEKTWGELEGGSYEHALQGTRTTLAALDASEEEAFNPTSVMPHCTLVDVHHALFQLDEARASLATALEYAPSNPIMRRFITATRQSTHHALRGDWSSSLAAAREAQSLRDAWDNPLPWFDFARYYETEALLRAGDRAAAEAAAQHLAAHLGTNQRYCLVWLRMQAVLDRHAGDHAAALVHLIEAASLATVLDLPSEAWQIANEQATTYADLSDRPHAQAARAEAEAGIARLATGIADTALREHFTQAALRHPPALH